MGVCIVSTTYDIDHAHMQASAGFRDAVKENMNMMDDVDVRAVLRATQSPLKQGRNTKSPTIAPHCA